MFSDSSDIESDDVAVIRHSILVPSEHFPFIQSLADFAKQACGWSGSLKKYLFAQTHDNTFAAIALCPPVAVALQVRLTGSLCRTTALIRPRIVVQLC